MNYKELNFREKYGEWAIILGATEGIGKAFAEAVADSGMSVVLVGRREQMLNELGESIKARFGVDYRVICADFAQPDAAEKVIAAADDLDIGFMSYVACKHQFGTVFNTSWEDHMAMLQVNVLSFMHFMKYYTTKFAERGRGAIVNMSSLTGVTSSPYIAQYGAGKAYIMKMTEAAAYECRKVGVDVVVATAGSTVTPTWLKNQPGGPEGEAARKNAMMPEEVVAEALAALGKQRSIVVGERNRAAVHHWQFDMTPDEAAAYMGSFYE